MLNGKFVFHTFQTHNFVIQNESFMKKILGVVSLIFILASCVEITDDISLKSDGSGTFKYVVNLSPSKLKINSILALDSLDGHKVPSLNDIKEKIEYYKDKLANKEGITNVKVDANYTEFILKFSCDFKRIENLQDAIKEIVEEESKNKEWKELDHNWLVWDGNKMTRSVPPLSTFSSDRLKKEDSEALKNGKYISITRFDRPIEKFENESGVLSSNKMAVMVKTNPYALMQNHQLLDNTIYLQTMKKP